MLVKLQEYATRQAELEKVHRQEALKKAVEESVCMKGWELIRDAYLPNLHSALAVNCYSVMHSKVNGFENFILTYYNRKTEFYLDR